MTCYRKPGTIEAVLLDVLNELSPAAIRKETSKTVEHFYNVSNPRTRLGLQFEDAAALDAALIASGKPPRFMPLMETMTLCRTNGRNSAGVNIIAEMLELSAREGALAAVIKDAMADNELEPHERREIARKAQDVGDTAFGIRDEVEPPHGPQEVA